jgi:glycosyltransferase involved in cell wall biosynthesis
MKNILFITAFKPSRISAGENFTRLLLDNLAINNAIDLVYFKRADETSFSSSNSNVKTLKEYQINKLNKLLTYIFKPYFFPVFRVRFNNSKKKEVNKLLNEKKYDLVILDYGQTFEVGLNIREKKILIAHDVLFQRYLRHNFLLGLWSKKTENKLLKQENAEIFTFSEKDKSLIYKHYKLNSNVTGFFLDDMVLNATPNLIDDYFVFFARWSRKDNSEGLEWFFDSVYPNLINPKRIKIIGAELDPKTALKLSKFNVEILGFIENPYLLIANSKALIAPLFNGAGVKVKVVEALACGTPVIGSNVSFEGIDSEFSNFMIECDSSQKYIERINEINFSVEERLNFKTNFVAKNNSNNIIQFVNSI